MSINRKDWYDLKHRVISDLIIAPNETYSIFTYLVWFDGSGDSGTVRRTKAIWECTLVRVTVGRPVRICLHGCGRERGYQRLLLAAWFISIGLKYH